MIFFSFIRACKKYMFTYVLSTYGGLELVLKPMYTFDKIKIKVDYCNYKKLFKQAIKAMKEYRRS